jgi:hypothetical protein
MWCVLWFFAIHLAFYGYWLSLFGVNTPASFSPDPQQSNATAAFSMDLACHRSTWTLTPNDSTIWDENQLIQWIWPCNDYTTVMAARLNGCEFPLDDKIRYNNRGWPLKLYMAFTHGYFWVTLPFAVMFSLTVVCINYQPLSPSEKCGNRFSYWIGLLLGYSLFFGIRALIKPENLQDAEMCAPRYCWQVTPSEYWLSPYVKCNEFLDYHNSYAQNQVSCTLQSTADIEIVAAAKLYCGGLELQLSDNAPAEALVRFRSHLDVAEKVESYKQTIKRVDLIWCVLCAGILGCDFILLSVVYWNEKTADPSSPPRTQPNERREYKPSTPNEHKEESPVPKEDKEMPTVLNIHLPWPWEKTLVASRTISRSPLSYPDNVVPLETIIRPTSRNTPEIFDFASDTRPSAPPLTPVSKSELISPPGGIT